MTSGVRQDRVITSDIKYAASKWSENPLTNTENHDFTRPLISENSDLKIFSGPEISLRLFGIPLQTIKATGYYSLEAQKSGSPLWRLFIGGDGQNSIIPDILGLNDGYVSNLTIQAAEIAMQMPAENNLVFDQVEGLLTCLAAYGNQVMTRSYPGNIKLDDLICLNVSYLN